MYGAMAGGTCTPMGEERVSSLVDQLEPIRVLRHSRMHDPYRSPTQTAECTTRAAYGLISFQYPLKSHSTGSTAGNFSRACWRDPPDRLWLLLSNQQLATANIIIGDFGQDMMEVMSKMESQHLYIGHTGD